MKIYIASIMLALILPLSACEKKAANPGKTAPDSSVNIQQGTDNVTKNWVDYAAQDNSYNVKFPGKPTEQIQTANSKSKLNVVLAIYEDKTAKRAYLASSFKYEVDPTKFDATKGLESAKSAIAKNATITTSEKNININGFAGKELTLKAKKGIGIRAKFFIDPKGPTLYQTQVLAADGQTDFPEADAFFDSFSLNK